MAAVPVWADEAVCNVFDKARQGETTPEEALERLKAGNQRFLKGRGRHCDLLRQVRATAGGQAPFAAVLGCIDSRVPPELIFDQEIGDIFTARVAGNVLNDDLLGSLEFATDVAGARLIVVLAHTDCGAVKGAIDQVKLGHLTGLLNRIQPAVTEAAVGRRGSTSKNPEFVEDVAERHARGTADALRARSAILRRRIDKGLLSVTSAMHDLTTGSVRWLS